MRISRKALNAFGLLLGIVGVIIIFCYGPPQPNFSEGISLGIDSPSVAVHDAHIAALRHTYTLWSRTGLGLILCGFIFQLLAEIRGDTTPSTSSRRKV